MWANPASNSAGGTRVVLPAPGSASSNVMGCCRTVLTISGNSASIGSSERVNNRLNDALWRVEQQETREHGDVRKLGRPHRRLIIMRIVDAPHGRRTSRAAGRPGS